MIERQRRKNLDGEYISEILGFSSDNPVVQEISERIWDCCQASNLYVADDLHDEETGEVYPGRGQLWACRSRLCPNCVGKLSKRNRKMARYVVENRRDVLVGTEWFFITLTMPDLSLKHLPLLECRSVINEAWRKFQRSRWFQNISRGGMKSEEFTVGEHNQYHYHLHLLAICRFKIKSNSFREIREEWTEALKFSFKKHNLKFDCNTSDKLAVCHIQKVWNKEKAILEICKYVTKSTDWAKIPPAQLADIASIKRFPRMFEFYGVCKDRANEIRPEARNKNDEKHTYLDTKQITVNSLHIIFDVSEITDAFVYLSIASNISVKKSNAPPLKSLTWRQKAEVWSREKCRQDRKKEIARCQTFRKRQLMEKFAFASFKTIDGKEF